MPRFFTANDNCDNDNDDNSVDDNLSLFNRLEHTIRHYKQYMSLPGIRGFFGRDRADEYLYWLTQIPGGNEEAVLFSTVFADLTTEYGKGRLGDSIRLRLELIYTLGEYMKVSKSDIKKGMRNAVGSHIPKRLQLDDNFLRNAVHGASYVLRLEHDRKLREAIRNNFNDPEKRQKILLRTKSF